MDVEHERSEEFNGRKKISIILLLVLKWRNEWQDILVRLVN
jgi:hypothetical protein